MPEKLIDKFAIINPGWSTTWFTVVECEDLQNSSQG